MKDDATIFMDYIGSHYDQIKQTLTILSQQRKKAFDEDAYHECILKCHKAITKKGELKDKSGYGITSYLIRAYFNYLCDIKKLASTSKRDLNYDSDNIGELHDKWYNENNVDAREKIKKDLYHDFATLYIMTRAEQQFDSESFYLFRVKELCPGMTYKKLAEATKIKGIRNKVTTVRRWLQDNVTKEEVTSVFYKLYDELL